MKRPPKRSTQPQPERKRRERKAPDTYRASSINRPRRTKAEIERIDQAIFDLVEAHQPMTVRQVFYRLVARGEIEKSEREYLNIAVRRLTQMRLDGRLPFEWIVDSTRWMRKPDTHDSLEDALWLTRSTYRRALGNEQAVNLEFWIEKNALAGVFYDVTAEYDVPLMVSVGFSSITYLHLVAQQIKHSNKPTFIYTFGDHDPSGVAIPRQIEKRLREFAPDAEIHCERVAVTEEQIRAWNLPTRPTKRTDPRAKSFEGRSVELDAIEPEQLRELARGCIERHIDMALLQRTRQIEHQERFTLSSIIARLEEGAFE